jgi:serine/threonine protein kinase
VRWEAQVLARIGQSKGILSADPPFVDEAGIVLPLEHFPGITLSTWVEKYGPNARGPRADLRARTDLWIAIARDLDEAHREGVVHRLLRPEVILVEDTIEPREIRVTGFDLAKQLSAETTVSRTTIADERLVMAAPEVVTAFSSAQPASDQFSLGAILALLLVGRPLFDSTRTLVASRRLVTRVRDVAQRVPLSLDEAVTRMLALRPTDRFPSLAEAIEAVRRGRTGETAPTLFPQPAAPLDPDNLIRGARVGTDYEILSRLGQGGLAVVYAARHLVSGRTRALKVSRPEESAESALRDEYRILSELDHPNIVKVIDLSKMVEGRLTLVMERVGGETLRTWIERNKLPDANARRRLARVRRVRACRGVAGVHPEPWYASCAPRCVRPSTAL